MPKGMTPKERMGRSTMSLARNLKPSGRLNVDDIKKAGKLRKTTPLSEQKNMKKFSKYMKQEPKKLNKPISSETMKKMAGMLGSSVGDIMSKKISKGPMQARPLPMTPELIKKAKDRMVPNPRAQQRERDRSKPIIGNPMRRSLARRK